jgi:hypothetical protein
MRNAEISTKNVANGAIPGFLIYPPRQCVTLDLTKILL